MIEVTLLNYLNDVDLSAKVYTEQPSAKPEAFFVIEKTGGLESEHIKEATFAIQSYAPTMNIAASMNEEIKAAMKEAITLPEISRVQLNSDYNYTDISTKTYRYQAVFVVTHY